MKYKVVHSEEAEVQQQMTTGFVKTLSHITRTLSMSHSTLLESGGGRLSRRHSSASDHISCLLVAAFLRRHC